MRAYPTTLALLLCLTACASPSSSPAGGPSPTGPAEVRFDLVETHAAQFDEEVPQRRAGSQEEAAAGSYILGHLQLAGFAPYLDAVPVKDQVRSTNVVALPPTGAAPEVVVSVAYDTGTEDQPGGRGIGLFLELARALNVAAPGHRVAFVAVGAESIEHRGSRRLAQYLLDEGWEPSVYSIGPVLPQAEDALSAAGFNHSFVDGNVRSVAGDLFSVLVSTES